MVVGVRAQGKSLGISFLALLCKVSERIRNLREIYTDLRQTRCRYEEVVCADSLPETVRLIVERLYLYLCVEPTRKSKHSAQRDKGQSTRFESFWQSRGYKSVLLLLLSHNFR